MICGRENCRDKTILVEVDTVIIFFYIEENIMVNSHRDESNQRFDTSTDRNREKLYATATRPHPFLKILVIILLV